MPKNNKYSDLKIFGFPEKIRSFQDGRITAPIYVRIKPINRCMHACHWCVYSDGKTRAKDRPELHLQSHMHEAMKESDVMPTMKAIELLTDLGRIGTKAVTFSGGGEPFMHPDFDRIVMAAANAGLDFSAITNGQMLTGEIATLFTEAKWVRISMDYTNAEEMVRSRNVAPRMFCQVISNIQQFSELRGCCESVCDLGINFIVTRENFTGLFRFAVEMKPFVDNIRFSPVYCAGFEEYHAPIAAHVREQLAEMAALCDEDFSVNSTYDLDSPSKKPVRPFERCLYAQTVPVVGADLNVYACHNTAYSDHGRLGSIRDQSFREMWFSAEAAAKMHTLNPSKVCNHECANHSKVELFERLAQAASDNFV